MSHNHLDKKIKEPLEQRKITPSQDAWKKLEAQLEPKRESFLTKKIVYWVAASLTIAFIAGRVFYKPSSDKLPVNVVNVGEKKPKEPFETEKNKAANEAVQLVKTDSSNSQREVENSKGKHTIVAVTENFKAVDAKQIASEEKVQNTIEKQKIDEVVSKIKEMQEAHEVTDAEINALLIEAQKSIAQERIMQQMQPDSLSATALLFEVETELDQSFKEKVFEALKNGFIKVKSAVAERNQ